MLQEYIEEEYSLSLEARRIVGCIIEWASDHYENKDGSLTEEGVHFLYEVLYYSIGIEEEEIREHWG